jgi:protein TonB
MWLSLKWTFSISVAVLALACFGFQSNPTAKPAPKQTTPTFKDAETIFAANCTGCHGGQRARGGIDLSNYDAIMKGGEDGPILKKGAPKHSLLVQALRGTDGVRQMPPRRPQLPEASIATIETWIKSGAKP